MSDIQGVVNDVRLALAENMIQGFVEAMRASGRSQSRQMRFLAEALAADAIPESLRRRVHDDIGAAAQRSVVQAYTHRNPRRNLPPYREGNDPRQTRYAGGRLLRALQSPSFYEATPNGLRFINTSLLNREARHWRRLNFGAGAQGGPGPRSFPIDLFQASIGLEPDRRPGFRLPPGFWLRNGERVAPGRPGTAEFHPGRDSSANPAMMTRGIRATNFLDAGVRRIANEIGPAYLNMYRQFYNDVQSRVRAEAQLRVRAPQPRSLRFRRLR